MLNRVEKAPTGTNLLSTAHFYSMLDQSAPRAVVIGEIDNYGNYHPFVIIRFLYF